MKIILASGSPRRKDLMDLAKIHYEIIVSNFNEKVDTHLSLQEQSKEIAYGKAKDVFQNTQGDRVVIGADTLVIARRQTIRQSKNKRGSHSNAKRIARENAFNLYKFSDFN